MKLRRLASVAGFILSAALLSAAPLPVGADAPRVSAPDQNGAAVDLGALYDRGLVLVFFYPKADTGGCTAQACSLRDAYEQLTERGVTVVGVSTDQEAAQKAFREKYQLPFVLLADHEKKVINGFGVPVSDSGRASRQAFLMQNGKIVWQDLTASTAQQAADVLAALAQLPPAVG